MNRLIFFGPPQPLTMVFVDLLRKYSCWVWGVSCVWIYNSFLIHQVGVIIDSLSKGVGGICVCSFSSER